MENRYQKNGFGEKWMFEISVKKDKFIEDKFCFLSKCIYTPVYAPVFLKATGCDPRWASGGSFFEK